MLYPAAKVVLIDPAVPNKLLLIFRAVNGSGGYEAAGGRIEADFAAATAENFEMCAIREIKEEVGVDVELITYLGSYSFFWNIKANTCSCCVVFLGKIIGGTINNHNPDLTELPFECRWVDAADIINDLIPVRNNHSGLKQLLIKAAKIVKYTHDKTSAIV